MGGKGSGRPQKSAKLKLDFRVAVNFTEAEFDAIKKAAALADLSMTEFCRREICKGLGIQPVLPRMTIV